MAENSLLKEILDTLSDPDTVKFFAAVHGLVGNSEVEHRLKELNGMSTLKTYGRKFFQQFSLH